MMDNEIFEKYGSEGASDYSTWEREYRKAVSFPADSDEGRLAILELKQKMLASNMKAGKNYGLMLKLFWALIIVAVGTLFVMATVGYGTFGAVVFVGGIVGAIAVWKLRANQGKRIEAFIDFDKQYFGGEMFSKMRGN